MPTVKKLSYAGITIPLATPLLERDWLGRINPRSLIEFWSPWNYDRPNTGSLPVPPVPVPRAFEIGVLDWPTGYTRPAFFHFVTNAERLALIRTAQGSSTSPQSLVFYDGRAGKTVTASMYSLPAIPLNLLGHDSSDAYLVTLTDRRFFDHWRRGVITTPSSWTHLFSQIATVLGLTITVDTVDSRYGTPSAKWALPYAPTPVLLDAVAAQVGQRVVVGLDGTVRTRNWETARTAADAYLTASDVVVSGGEILESDIARYVPASVKTLFLDTTNSPPSATPHVETRTLAALAIAEYGAATGVVGFYQTIPADLTYTPSTSSQVGSCADAMSEDWYGWRLSNLDLVYPGVEPWVPTGWEDRVEWVLQKRDPEPIALTRVHRGVWNDFNAGDWYAGYGSSNPDPFNPCGSGLAPGCVPVAGSGSGSGGGCDRVVETLDVSCGTGTRVLTSKFFDLQVVDGRTEIVECSTQDYDLGPCSPDNPGGTQVPAVTAVCPDYFEPRCVSADYTLDPDDRVILADASGGGFTITLPPWREGDEFWVLKDYDGENPVVVGDITLTIAGSWVHVVADCDGGWAYLLGGPPTGGDTGITELTGDVVAGPGSGSQAATITPQSVTNDKFRDSVANSVVGRAGGTPGSVADIQAVNLSGVGALVFDQDAGVVKFVQSTTANVLLGSTDGEVPAWLAASGVTVGVASTVTVADAGGDTTTWPLVALNQTGNESPRTDAGLTYNASTNALTTTTFIGALSGNATTATTLQTARAIYGNNFDGSAALTQVIASTYGGTGNGFAKFSGPATTEKTFTLPNATCTILTTNDLVTVAQGGTGVNTLTSNGVVIGNGTSGVTVTAEGATGKILTGVTGADPTFQDPITATRGSANLSADYTISASAGTYVGSGLSVTLPAAGRYRIECTATAQLATLAGAGSSFWYIQGKLRNTTDSSDIAQTEGMIAFTDSNHIEINQRNWSVEVNVAASKTIELYVRRDGNGTPTFGTSFIAHEGTGAALMEYFKIGN